MKYKEYIPGEALKPYVQCYYVYEPDTGAVLEDKAFATGCVEMMFNLGTGKWETGSADHFTINPAIELWGQIIQPLSFRSIGKNSMLGIRFHPQTASIFLNEDLSLFNNQVSDLSNILGKTVVALHAGLMDTDSTDKRIVLVESYLLSRLYLFEKKLDNINLVSSVISELKQVGFFDNIENVAARYGISARYLQKLFLQCTGLTPKLYSKINRFQNSLLLVSKKDTSLTDIAYECGYFDQSHFIREFKSFTGLIPSGYNPVTSSAILASPNK